MRRPRNSVRSRRAVKLLTAPVAAVIWIFGLFQFADGIPGSVVDEATRTDAIVVLTGGSRRLGKGLDLLSQGLAENLFVSGVYRGVEVDEILRVFRQAPEALECCVALGHSATDTRSNAHETARWMVLEGFSSLRLVTASYHMPRSLVEFRRVMPDVQLIAHPVFPAHVRLDAWWRWPGTASLLASEYTKYLVATVTPAWLASAMVPDQEATAP